MVRANKNLELALEVSTKAQAVVLANVEVLAREADLTEQWQLGPQMVLSQGLRLVPESHKLLVEMRAIQERVGPLFRYGHSHAPLDCSSSVAHRCAPISRLHEAEILALKGEPLAHGRTALVERMAMYRRRRS